MLKKCFCKAKYVHLFFSQFRRPKILQLFYLRMLQSHQRPQKRPRRYPQQRPDQFVVQYGQNLNLTRKLGQVCGVEERSWQRPKRLPEAQTPRAGEPLNLMKSSSSRCAPRWLNCRNYWEKKQTFSLMKINATRWRTVPNNQFCLYTKKVSDRLPYLPLKMAIFVWS